MKIKLENYNHDIYYIGEIDGKETEDVVAITLLTLTGDDVMLIAFKDGSIVKLDVSIISGMLRNYSYFDGIEMFVGEELKKFLADRTNFDEPKTQEDN